MNKKVRNFTKKSGRVLLNFSLILLQTQQSYQSTHSFHKHEQLHAFPVFRSCSNEIYDQSIPTCRLLGSIIYQLSLFSDYLRHCLCLKELDQLAFLPELHPLLLKDPVSVLQPYLFPI